MINRPRSCYLLCLSLLAACSTSAPDKRADVPAQRTGVTMVWGCGEMEFITRTGPGEMALWLEDRYMVLSQTRSASGARYEEADIIFWNKGSEASLQVGEQQYRQCQQRPARVPWEDARRRGVDFRAVGNEPGWYLELQEGRQILYVGNYGVDRWLLPTPQPIVADGYREYRVDDERQLHIRIEDEPCSDSMADEQYPARVLIAVDGRELEGCGEYLDFPWEQ